MFLISMLLQSKAEPGIRGDSHPYLTAEVKLLMSSRDSLKAKANKTGSKYIKLTYQHMKNKVDYKTFVPLGGSGGMLPQKILKN